MQNGYVNYQMTNLFVNYNFLNVLYVFAYLVSKPTPTSTHLRPTVCNSDKSMLKVRTDLKTIPPSKTQPSISLRDTFPSTNALWANFQNSIMSDNFSHSYMLQDVSSGK